jgi:nitric oxide reductase subunit C
MSTRSAKLIFWIGTLSSALLFLALTWDTHRQVDALTHADKLSDQVVAGKRVFQKYNCNDCHTILGFGGYYAPDLTRVYARTGEAYIRQAVTRPELTFANSFRHMPQQHVRPQELSDLIAFLSWVNGINNGDWPPQDSKKRLSEVSRLVGGAGVSPGAALFKSNGCFDCHSLHGVGGDAGPALDEVGTHRSKDYIEKFIANPTSLNPSAQMPAFDNLTPAELDQLADFLTKQQGGGI